jgi:alkylation response protein AidB-like acyl-CoA dehydrogenase
MDLQLEPEHLALEESAAALLNRHAALEVMARAAHSGKPFSTGPLWHAVADADWLLLGVGTETGFDLVGAAVIARQIGARAAPLPLAEHVATARLVACAGPDRELIPSRWSVATFAALEEHTDWGLSTLRATAQPSGSGWRVRGVKVNVPHAADADVIGVLAPAAGRGLGLFLIEPGAEGVSIEPMTGFDASRAPSRVGLADVAVDGDAVILGDQAAAAIREVMAAAAVLTAAEGLGAASRMLDDAVVYARQRLQFGRAIGEYQAVQHLLADLHVLRETTWSTVLYAAAALDSSQPDAEHVARIAKGHASAAIRSIGEGALQVFGGIGFSEEHHAHLLFRRVLDCEQRFGDTAQQYAAIAAELARDRR